AIADHHRARSAGAGINRIVLRKTKQAVDENVRASDRVKAVVVRIRDGRIVNSVHGGKLDERRMIDKVQAALVLAHGDGALEQAVVPDQGSIVAVAYLSGVVD